MTVLSATMDRLLNQRTIFDSVKVLRGEAISQRATIMNTPIKNANLMVVSWVVIKLCMMGDYLMVHLTILFIALPARFFDVGLVI